MDVSETGLSGRSLQAQKKWQHSYFFTQQITAVGSIVCQIGKILGCFVIGVAGSAEKCKFLTDECGCDVALDYHDFKTVKDAREALDKASGGRGIDIYFDNVGGYVHVPRAPVARA